MAWQRLNLKGISIHAPRAGSDTLYSAPHTAPLISIHAPRAGSDVALVLRSSPTYISIHAPRAGSDPPRHPRYRCAHANFNPRSPCGERLARGEHADRVLSISIHAPRAGSDEEDRE